MMQKLCSSEAWSLTDTFLHLFYKVQSKDVAMLLKVKYQNTKKYIRLLSGFTFLDFIAQGE